MDVVKARAPAKVNLCLLVGPKGSSGYHQVFTVLAPVDLYDEIELALDVELKDKKDKADGELCVECRVAPGEINLVARALRALEREARCRFLGRIVIRKGIPSGAGLGGGSSDAALVLTLGARMITEAGGPELDEVVLRRLALQLGADVPFFLNPVPSLARGIGEVLEPLALPVLWLALLFGNQPLSTSQVYRVFDELAPAVHFLSFARRAEEAERQWRLICNPAAAAALLHNDLEAAAFSLTPSLRELRELIVREGALGALMSGSGSALFGLCDSEKKAIELVGRLHDLGLQAQVVRVLAGSGC